MLVIRITFISFLFLLAGGGTFIHASGGSQAFVFPTPLEDYALQELKLEQELGHELSIGEILLLRIKEAPINLLATLLFIGAIVHTFFATKFNKMAHHYEEKHQRQLDASGNDYPPGKEPVSFKATMCHFLGEVEAVFGIWVVPLILVIVFTQFDGWQKVIYYFDNEDFTEPVFVVVIMAIAATKPIVKFAERGLRIVASLGKETPAAWWLSILILGPLLGSFITEPAAMTIAALLLGQQFYKYKPSTSFKYATLGLLFVNISVGGTLTQFAAPPVLMVAGPWNWDMAFMFFNFGDRAVLGIIISTLVYFFLYRKDFVELNKIARQSAEMAQGKKEIQEEPVPYWVILVHIGFLAWTVFTLHHPALFVGGFLFFLAFTVATTHFQYAISLKGPVLVGFFLAALKIHGGLQGWWISPVLESLSEVPLFLGATILTAFNDNAAITYLAAQVPAFDPAIAASFGPDALAIAERLQYAVVAGAVTGGGLTVIANAPNPAGQSLLSKYFEDGISPKGLLLGALFPTFVMAAVFLLF